MSHVASLVQSLESLVWLAGVAILCVGCLWGVVTESSAREALRGRVIVFAMLGALAVAALLAGLERTGLCTLGFWAVYVSSVAALPAWSVRLQAVTIAGVTGVLVMIAAAHASAHFAALRVRERLGRVPEVEHAAREVIEALERCEREAGRKPTDLQELVELGWIEPAHLRVSSDSVLELDPEFFAGPALYLSIAPDRVRADRLWWRPDRSESLGPSAWRRGDWVYFDELREDSD